MSDYNDQFAPGWETPEPGHPMNYTDEDVERVARAIEAREVGDDNYFVRGADAVELARAALSAMPRHVPEGWVLVPKEPTEDMVLAGRNSPLVTPISNPRQTYDNIYTAMLAAAPPAPLSEASGKPVNTQLEK